LPLSSLLKQARQPFWISMESISLMH